MACPLCKGIFYQSLTVRKTGQKICGSYHFDNGALSRRTSRCKDDHIWLVLFNEVVFRGYCVENRKISCRPSLGQFGFASEDIAKFRR
jgi:hypothetical protein